MNLNLFGHNLVKKHIIIILLTFFICALTTAQTSNSLLQELNALNLSGFNITEIEDVLSGQFTLPGGKIAKDLPPFLRIAFTSKPTPESNIRIELWLPKDTWNGSFLGTGSGGGGGKIIYNGLISGVIKGYATANTDMGTSPGVDKIIDYPERWADFGYRSTHLMTVLSKKILETYYKKTPLNSYFLGCSTGGEQAMMEAQRYPEDYNGVIAGAPASNRTHLHTLFLWNLINTYDSVGNALISSEKMELLKKILLQNYKGKDGGAPSDNFFTDQRMLNFDSEILPKCSESVLDSCFSRQEIAVLKKLYDGPTNMRTGQRIYAPSPLGATSLEVTPSSSLFYMFKWIFGENYDYTKFDFDNDMQKMDSILAPILNANNPNLSAFKNSGGKLLMYTGTEDQIVPYPDAINYYERVIEAQGSLKETQNFFRFFLVPGMGHCNGGPGLNDIGDKLAVMRDWVEKGIAPDKIIATAFICCDKSETRFKRPIYPYPKFPHYIGGNPNSPSSYDGVDHPRGEVLKPDPIYLK
ncbi:MAG: tannase/feruloyl esterase family alpha/beta hydrolase [Paludibacter sp.]|nr:tannase/feruloyl esterase family alpha/beta hydrolase [Paludibacter sp.]